MNDTRIALLAGPNAKVKLRIRSDGPLRVGFANGFRKYVPSPGRGTYELDTECFAPGAGTDVFPVEVWEVADAEQSRLVQILYGTSRGVIRYAWASLRAKWPDAPLSDMRGTFRDVIRPMAVRQGAADPEYVARMPAAFDEVFEWVMAEIAFEERTGAGAGEVQP